MQKHVNPAAPQAGPKASPREWIGLAALALPCVIYSMDLTVLYLAVPQITADLRPSASQLLWIVDIYGFLVAGSLVTMGTLGDRIGRRRVLLYGATAFAVTSVLAAYSTSAEMLIFARALQGIAAATLAPSTLSLIRNMFNDPRERTLAIGVWVASFSVGAVIGPLVGGLILAHFFWGAVFLLNVPIAATALVASILIVPDSRDPSGASLDLPGALLSIVGITALVFGIIEAPGAGWTDPLILGSFALAAILGVAFAWRETHTAHPMLDIALFRNPRFSAGAGAIGLTFFAMFAMIFGLTQYLQFVLGKTALEAGLLMLALAFGIPIGARASVKAVERAGTKRVLSVALVVIAVVLASFALWDVDTADWTIVLTLFVLAFAMANVMAPATASVMGAVPEAKAGVGSAMNDLVRQLGGALGVAVIGSVMNTVYRDQMTDVVAGLPAALADAASDSVGAAVAIGTQVGGAAGDALAAAARTSFVDALGVAAPVAAVVALATAGLVARYMPARPQPAEPVPAATAPQRRPDTVPGAAARPADRQAQRR
jgi:DHA2 family multidrug resistance protein-like MFS transporter